MKFNSEMKNLCMNNPIELFDEFYLWKIWGLNMKHVFDVMLELPVYINI